MRNLSIALLAAFLLLPVAHADPRSVKSAIEDNQPVKGPDDARVTIVVVGDFQCPYCAKVQGALRAVEEAYPTKVRFVWANGPLPFHSRAMPAAMAAMAAHEQGKFWEFHDRLFADPKHLDAATFEKYARELDLDVKEWKEALTSSKNRSQIEDEIRRFGALGASGTPAFFVNGELLMGAQPFEAFQAAIQRALGSGQ